MYILAIETTGPYGSVALISDTARIAAHRVSKESMSHLKDLMPMISDMLSEVGADEKDIFAIACDVGPGSFTGIRIGVSTARALAQIWKLPCIEVSSLTSAILKERPEGMDYKDTIVDGYLEPGPWMIDDVIRIAKEEIAGSGEILFYGDGVDSYGDILKDAFEGTDVRYRFAPVEIRYQDAKEIAQVGLLKYADGQTVDHRELLPEYMREAEAETKLKAGELPISRLPKQE